MKVRSCLVCLLPMLFMEMMNSMTYAQTPLFPYHQNFDSASPPALPPGWTSTQNRTPGFDDFTTSASTARSAPNVALSTNATIAQALISPVFDFSGSTPDRIMFYTRRSSTHLARVVVEASLDSGTTYTIQVGDSLTNTGTTNYVQTDFLLPAVLAGFPAVRFRWRVVPDASGTTGTFRMDDLTITTRRVHDLAAARVQVTPPMPVEGDSLECAATVRNNGEAVAPAFTVDFFVDANNDSIPQAGERVASTEHGIPLGVAESTIVAAAVPPWPPSQRLVMVRVVYIPDQDTTNNIMRMRVTIGYRAQSLVVNEVMYAPAAPEPEWAELYNTREDSIDVRGWYISDNTVSSRRIITSASFVIPRNGYAVLTRDSTAFMDAHPGTSVRVINVPGMPALNNTGDAVSLYDDRLVVMDSMAYMPTWGGNSGGYSLERLDPAGPSGVQSNWGTSRSVVRSTPGGRNSLSRKDHDIRVDTIFIAPTTPLAGDTVEVLAEVRNPGIEPAGPFRVDLYYDANNDSLVQPSELVASISQTVPLQPLDSVGVAFQIPAVRAGTLSLIAVAVYEQDEDSTNNTHYQEFIVGYRVGVVRINEIMYAPPTGIPEWVELANASADTVDLRSWKIGSRSTSSRYTITQTSLLLPPEHLLVVAKDTALLRAAYPGMPDRAVQLPAFPTFLWNNNGDAVVVEDNRARIMDSLFYQPAWGGLGGASLERRDLRDPTNDSTNWATSEDSLGATPGSVNSIVTVDHDLEVLRAAAAPAAPGVPAFLSITVRNVGRLGSTMFTLLLYHDRDRDSVPSPGELIRRLDIGQSLARRESLLAVLDWQDPPPGKNMCIVVIDYQQDQRPANNRRGTGVRVGSLPRSVVVNEIMYSPLTGNAEYVELMNNTAADVDITGWSVLDRQTSSGSQNRFILDTTSGVLHPGELFVLASDSTLFNIFPYLSGEPRLIRVANVPSLGLNNEGDDVLVRDLTETTIDSIAYGPGWHNPDVFTPSGRSLEKINPSLDGNDRRSWSTCALPAGGSPGRVNSIYASVLPSAAALSFSPNPFSPDGDGAEDVTIIHYEVPLTVATMSINIYDVRGRLIRRLVNNEPGRPRGDIAWDGRDDEQRKARMGIYVVLIQALNEKGGMLETAKGVVVLAGRL